MAWPPVQPGTGRTPLSRPPIPGWLKAPLYQLGGRPGWSAQLGPGHPEHAVGGRGEAPGVVGVDHVEVGSGRGEGVHEGAGQGVAQGAVDGVGAGDWGGSAPGSGSRRPGGHSREPARSCRCPRSVQTHGGVEGALVHAARAVVLRLVEHDQVARGQGRILDHRARRRVVLVELGGKGGMALGEGHGRRHHRLVVAQGGGELEGGQVRGLQDHRAPAGGDGVDPEAPKTR